MTTVRVVPSPAAVRAHRRRVLRSHGRSLLRAALGATWDVLIGAAVLGGIGAQAGRRLVGGFPAHRELAPAATAGWLLAAVAVALLGAAVRGLAAAGPVSAQPAALTWVFAGPVDRAGLLAPRLWTSAAGSLAVGAAVGALLPLPTEPGAVTLVAAAVTGALVGLAALLTTAAAQQRSPRLTTAPATLPRPAGGPGVATVAAGAAGDPAAAGRARRGLRRGRWGAGTVGGGLVASAAVGGLVVAVLGLAGHPLPAPPTGPVLLVVAGLAAVVAAVTGRRAHAGLGTLDRGTLAAGGALVLGLSTSVAWLDTSLLRGVADDRRWRTRATVRSRRLHGTGPTVLIRADLRRMARRPDRVLGWAALAVVPYVVAAVAAPIWTAVAQVLAGALAVSLLTPGLRTIADQPGLRRMLGLEDRQLQNLHTVVPGAGAVLWALATAPALAAVARPELAGAAAGEPALGASAAAAIGALAAAVRAATRPPIDYGGAVAPDVGLGSAPVGLIAQVLRGADVALVLAGLVLAGASFPVRAALAVAALAWSLRSPTTD